MIIKLRISRQAKSKQQLTPIDKPKHQSNFLLNLIETLLVRVGVDEPCQTAINIITAKPVENEMTHNKKQIKYQHGDISLLEQRHNIKLVDRNDKNMNIKCNTSNICIINIFVVDSSINDKKL